MSRANMILNMISLHKKFIVKAAHMSIRNISMSSALRKNYYDVLGLPRDATQAEIKNAYFELSKLYHPDRIAATDENLTKFREISAAYEVLGNEQSRQLYDKGLLGEIKPTAEEDISDPIIQFYKKRQEISKFHATEENEAWAQTYFTEAKKRASKKHELFKESAKEDEHKEDPYRFTFQFHSIILLALFISTSFADSLPNRLWNNFRSYLKN